MNKHVDPWQAQSIGSRKVEMQDPWIPFEGTLNEMAAIDRVIEVYCYVLEHTMPPTSERSMVIAALRSFQLRPRQRKGQVVVWSALQAEALAFGSAVIFYCRLVTLAMPYAQVEAPYKQCILGFQQRYMKQLNQRDV